MARAHRLLPFAALLAVLVACYATLSAVASTSPMPYRPGYGIGSWLPDSVVDGMRREAAARSEILLTTTLDNDIQSIAKELKLANDASSSDLMGLPPPMDAATYADTMSTLTKARGKVWERKVGALKNLVKQIESQLTSLTEASNSPTGVVKDGAFTTFAMNAESGTEWTTSEIGKRELSFDSFNVEVHYVSNKQNNDRRSSSTHSSDIAKALTNYSRDTTGHTSNVQVEAARRAKEQAAAFLADTAVSGTLILSAFATHRNVLQFNRLNINADRLRRAWNFYKTNNSAADPLNQHETFREQLANETARDPSTADRIHMVSEMYKGSALVGMVHFTQTNATNMTDLNSELRNGTAASDLAGQDVKDQEGQGHDRKKETEKMSKAQQEASRIIKLASNARYQVHFSLVAVGYIPKMTPSTLIQTVEQIADFDPGRFRVPSILDAQADPKNALSQVRQNMQAVVGATIHAVGAVEQEKLEVLDITTFMTAFDDYVTAAQNADDKKSIGAPVGFNVRDFTKLDVLSALASKYLGNGLRLAVDQSDGATNQTAATPTPAAGTTPTPTPTPDQ